MTKRILLMFAILLLEIASTTATFATDELSDKALQLLKPVLHKYDSDEAMYGIMLTENSLKGQNKKEIIRNLPLARHLPKVYSVFVEGEYFSEEYLTPLTNLKKLDSVFLKNVNQASDRSTELFVSMMSRNLKSFDFSCYSDDAKDQKDSLLACRKLFTAMKRKKIEVEMASLFLLNNPEQLLMDGKLGVPTKDLMVGFGEMDTANTRKICEQLAQYKGDLRLYIHRVEAFGRTPVLDMDFVKKFCKENELHWKVGSDGIVALGNVEFDE